jgi:hypothetical protein
MDDDDDLVEKNLLPCDKERVDVEERIRIHGRFPLERSMVMLLV